VADSLTVESLSASPHTRHGWPQIVYANLFNWKSSCKLEKKSEIAKKRNHVKQDLPVLKFYFINYRFERVTVNNSV